MMKRYFVVGIMILLGFTLFAQVPDTSSGMYKNAADNLLIKDSKFLVGGYGEVHFNQPINTGVKNNGVLDVHRMVMLFGYNFNEKTQFITELEFEHVKEVFVEQAFLQHKLNKFINFRAGLLLVPMGIINEYHEPTTFNGVERPTIDKTITPTTWREIGFGITGNILTASVKYQAYLMNGFNGYDGDAKLNGKNGLRSGRQKGAESFITSPGFSGKIEYYGIRGLNTGISGYFGKTQSTLFDGIDKNDDEANAIADSSIVGIAMLGADLRYSRKGFQVKGQLYYTKLNNTEQYNIFTSDGAILNDLGRSMLGYYVETGYNVLRNTNSDNQIIPFLRYEFLNTHNTVENNISRNLLYKKTIITTGLTLALTEGAVIKTDVQFMKNGSNDEFSKIFNAGIGVMF